MEQDTRTKEYIEKLSSFKLSETARTRMKGELLAYARFHGVREAAPSRSIERVPQRTSLFTAKRASVAGETKRSKISSRTERVPAGKDNWSLLQESFTRLYNSTLKPMNALIIIALLVSGGTSYAAAGSVPGDFLYPIKVEVNENVESAFTVTNGAEAKLQAKFAAERLEEAETLAARGELDATASAHLATRLKAHYNEAIERSARAEAEGDVDSSASVRASLEGTLNTYASILTTLGAGVNGNDSAVLIADIEAYAAAAAITQATATTHVSASERASIQSAIVNTDTLIAHVESNLTRAETKLKSETHAWIDSRLDVATKAQAEAKVKLQAELYSDSYAAVQNAIRIANEAQAMIDSAVRLEADVNINTGDLFKGVLNIKHETTTGSSTKQDATSTTTVPKTEDKKDGNVDLNLDVEVNTDAGISSDAINTDLETDTVVNTDTGLDL